MEGRISPSAPEKFRYWARASAWNVRTRTPPTPSAASRLPISLAALSVKVTARILPAAWVPPATWWAIRRVMVVVFPDPAPARITTGPCTAATACAWASLRPSKIGAMLEPVLEPVLARVMATP